MTLKRVSGARLLAPRLHPVQHVRRPTGEVTSIRDSFESKPKVEEVKKEKKKKKAFLVVVFLFSFIFSCVKFVKSVFCSVPVSFGLIKGKFWISYTLCFFDIYFHTHTHI